MHENLEKPGIHKKNFLIFMDKVNWHLNEENYSIKSDAEKCKI